MQEAGEPARQRSLSKYTQCMSMDEALQIARAEGFPLVPAPNTTGFRGVYFRQGDGADKPGRRPDGDRYPYKVRESCRGFEPEKVCCMTKTLASVAVRAAADANVSERMSALGYLPPVDVHVDKRLKTLGSFSNPEAASLAYARHIGRDEALKAQAAYENSLVADAPPTSEQALELAKREGLTSERAPGSRSGYRGVSFDERAKKGKPFLACFTTPGAKGKQQHLGSFQTAEEAALHHARRQAEFERVYPDLHRKMGWRGHPPRPQSS